jgi:EAL domain-containing protein (putative c-di-GMP-specific phosphodiesterase class I)/CheY-like chemotaxis protein
MPETNLRVLVVDDHRRVAEGLAATLRMLGGFDVVGVAVGVAEAAEMATWSRPDVALVDVHMPDGGGVSATREILAGSVATRVLALSVMSDRDSVIEMLRAGASGYVVKGGAPTDLAEAVRRTARGETALDEVVTRRVVHELIHHVEEAARAEDEAARKRRRIEALIRGEGLEMVFQPIVDLASRSVVGHEALARFMLEPRRDPRRWFEEAHQLGLGVELEVAAVRGACEHAPELPSDAYLAVNVSPVTAESPELRQVLSESRVERIVLEVTEHAPVEDYGRFRSAVNGVREHGARLAVDDAGAGFASLRHILELEAEIIKLDSSLTHSLEDDPRRRSLASALIEFGRRTGAAVVAEGIESELQVSELRRLGIRLGQGYHLGRPRPQTGRRFERRRTASSA